MDVSLVMATRGLVAISCVGLVVGIVVWLEWHKRDKD